MTRRDLTRMLWRVHYGTYDKTLFEIELRAEIDDIGSEALPLLDRSATIRLWNDGVLRRYREMLSQARRAVDFGDYRAAVSHLRHCRALLRAIAALLEAIDAVELTSDKVDALAALCATPRLRRLPAVAALAQIVDAAKLAIAGEQQVQALHIARTCGRLASALLVESKLEPAARNAIEDRLDAIARLCRATRRFAPSPDDDPERDGSLAVLRSLLDRGFATLAARLTTELEIDLGGRQRFLRHFESHGFGEIDELCRLVCERAWDGAVDHSWHLAIETHAGKLAQLRARAATAAAELDAALAPPAPPADDIQNRGE